MLIIESESETWSFHANYTKLSWSKTSQWKFKVSLQIIESYPEVKLHNGGWKFPCQL